MRLAFLGCVIVLVTACKVNHPDQYLTSPSESDKVIRVSSAQASIPADGFSRVRITAEITPDADASKRDVKFTTTAGTLVGTTSGGVTVGNEATVRADEEGHASIDLQSSDRQATAVVRASVALTFTADTRVDFLAADPAATISLRFDLPLADADDATLSRAVVTVNPQLANRTVTFTSTLGTSVTPSTVTPGASNSAAVFVKSGTQTGVATLVATLQNGTSAQSELTLQPALPTDILLTTDKAVLPRGSSTVQLTAILSRTTGKVSLGTPVWFAATDENGRGAGGVASQVPTDANSTSKITWDRVDPLFTGRVTFRASVPKTSLSASTEVVVQ
jgi:hypothetical protein